MKRTFIWLSLFAFSLAAPVAHAGEIALETESSGGDECAEQCIQCPYLYGSDCFPGGYGHGVVADEPIIDELAAACDEPEACTLGQEQASESASDDGGEYWYDTATNEYYEYDFAGESSDVEASAEAVVTETVEQIAVEDEAYDYDYEQDNYEEYGYEEYRDETQAVDEQGYSYDEQGYSYDEGYADEFGWDGRYEYYADEAQSTVADSSDDATDVVEAVPEEDRATAEDSVKVEEAIAADESIESFEYDQYGYEDEYGWYDDYESYIEESVVAEEAEEVEVVAEVAVETTADDVAETSPITPDNQYDDEYGYGQDWDDEYEYYENDGYEYDSVATEADVEVAEAAEPVEATEAAPAIEAESWDDTEYGYGYYYDYYDYEFDAEPQAEADATESVVEVVEGEDADAGGREAILSLAHTMDRLGSALQSLSRHLTEIATGEVAELPASHQTR